MGFARYPWRRAPHRGEYLPMPLKILVYSDYA